LLVWKVHVVWSEYQASKVSRLCRHPASAARPFDGRHGFSTVERWSRRRQARVAATRGQLAYNTALMTAVRGRFSAAQDCCTAQA